MMNIKYKYIQKFTLSLSMKIIDKRVYSNIYLFMYIGIYYIDFIDCV